MFGDRGEVIIREFGIIKDDDIVGSMNYKCLHDNQTQSPEGLGTS